MATTQAQLKTVATDDEQRETQTTDHVAGLAEIVAQTTQFEVLPDFDIYSAACTEIQDSIERVAAEAI